MTSQNLNPAPIIKEMAEPIFQNLTAAGFKVSYLLEMFVFVDCVKGTNEWDRLRTFCKTAPPAPVDLIPFREGIIVDWHNSRRDRKETIQMIEDYERLLKGEKPKERKLPWWNFLGKNPVKTVIFWALIGVSLLLLIQVIRS